MNVKVLKNKSNENWKVRNVLKKLRRFNVVFMNG